MIKHIFFKVTNEKDSELEACEYLDLFARKCGYSQDVIDEMRLAFIEALINAKEHAPKDLPDGDKNDIHVALTYNDEAIDMQIRDFGRGFDPTLVEKPDIKKKLKSSYKRGWGLMLMERLSDGAEISSFPPSGTLIHLVKKKIATEVAPKVAETLKEQKRLERLRYILSSFIDLSSFLCQSKNLQSGLRSMLRILLGTIGVSRGAIYNFSDDCETLSCIVDIKLKANAKLPQLRIHKDVFDKLAGKSDCVVTDIIKSEVSEFNDAFKDDDIEHIYVLKTDECSHGLLILGKRIHKEEEDFDNELLTVIARNISSAINTYKLMENLKNANVYLDKRLVELDKVREATNVIASELEIENLPNTVASVFRNLLGIRKFSMTIYDACDKHFHICNNDRGLPSIVDMWSSQITQKVVESKEAIHVKNLKEKPEFSFPRCKNYDSDSFAVIPVLMHDEVVATINLSDKDGDGIINDKDFEICKLLCSQLGIAIKNCNLYKLGITDALTGMFTNHYFRLRLSQEISRIRRVKSNLSMIMIGIDNYNSIIEKCKSPVVKDDLIKKLGLSIKKIIRFNDFSCRFQGDKFLILMPDTTRDGANNAAEKIYKNIKNFKYKDDNNTFKIDVTVTINEYDVKYNANEFIEISEKHLIEGQSQGGDRIIVIN